ncbi:MAG: calcium/sodium antiporter [Bacteroidales bacterium]|nr:calcium/sodium antiporter [Bacteroidales bacterium]
MTVTVLLLIAGLALILAGANYLVDGASRIASRFGISDVVIGMTIVAIGTSAPEAVVSFLGTIKGSVGITVGNIVGSNICNILLILGLSCALVPLKITRDNLGKDLQFLTISSLVLIIICFDNQINQLLVDDDMSQNVISRGEGLVMLILFCIFLGYNFFTAKRKEESEQEKKEVVKKNIWLSLLMFFGGLAALIYGGNLLVDSATDIAKRLGVSDLVIASTIVAVGTSIPELATSVIAAVKKKGGLALGNVVGSNVFNTFLILGGCSVISPLQLSGINHSHFIFLLVSTLVLVLFSATRRRISRAEGILLLALYVLYVYSTITVG